MNHSNIVLVYTTVESLEQAEDLARKAIESRCAVCVNIMAPHKAIYLGEGGAMHRHELGLLIKILEEYYDVAYEAIKGWHPYKVPALLAWPAEPNPAYSIWAHHQVTFKNQA